jgi:nucleoid-associated protein YgaU
MPGAWSNIMSIQTARSVGAISKAYAYNSSKNISVAGGNVGGGACTQYTVLPGDSFWSIAQKLLGAGGRYFELWNTNKLKFPSLNSSSMIRTGWSLSVGC